MHWYEGGIAEAVSLSRKNGSIFVVYVEGQDDQSRKLTNIINEDSISKELGSNNFVAIKVEANSVPHQQFAEIFKGVKVPSIYFIGKSGVPLDIVEDVSDSVELSQKIENVLNKGGISVSKPATQAQHSSNLISQEKKDVVCENGVCTLKTNQPEASASTSANADITNVENTEPTLSAEERAEKAKELIERNRLAKQREEEEKERLKEMERRKMGQDVQKMKRLQQDQELKQLIEAREKEKREQQAAKQRILDQIKQDKADRAARFLTSPQPVPSPAPTTSPPAQKVLGTGMTRIQFKLPDGSTHTHEFRAESTLHEVKIYIKTSLNLTFNFVLATTFPRREFTDEHDSNTLAELELVPSAVLLILLVAHGAVSTNSRTFTSFLWSLLAPMLNVITYLRSMVFGAPRPSEQPTTSQDSNKRPADTAGESLRPAPKKRSGESTVIKRQGNIHRLTDKNDSDDDTNTWNGNSTQQM